VASASFRNRITIRALIATLLLPAASPALSLAQQRQQVSTGQTTVQTQPPIMLECNAHILAVATDMSGRYAEVERELDQVERDLGEQTKITRRANRWNTFSKTFMEVGLPSGLKNAAIARMAAAGFAVSLAATPVVVLEATFLGGFVLYQVLNKNNSEVGIASEDTYFKEPWIENKIVFGTPEQEVEAALKPDPVKRAIDPKRVHDAFNTAFRIFEGYQQRINDSYTADRAPFEKKVEAAASPAPEATRTLIEDAPALSPNNPLAHIAPKEHQRTPPAKSWRKSQNKATEAQLKMKYLRSRQAYLYKVEGFIENYASKVGPLCQSKALGAEKKATVAIDPASQTAARRTPAVANRSEKKLLDATPMLEATTSDTTQPTAPILPDSIAPVDSVKKETDMLSKPGE
jgi:hypothetical protein